MRAAMLLALLAAALAGCAAPGAREACEAPFPLAIDAYPMVTDRSRYEVQTTLFNCTDSPIPLDDPCDARDGLKPSLSIANETYYLAHELNGSAARREDIACFDRPVAPRAEAEPGAYLQQRYPWDGTYRPDGGAPVPVPPGEHQVTVRAGPYLASARVTVPW